MLIQTKSAPRYARRNLNVGRNADQFLATQHLVHFWQPPIIEGRACAQGHLIDADEEEDPLVTADDADMHEPEAQGGRYSAQLGEFLRPQEEPTPCDGCTNLWCMKLFCSECDCIF